MAEEVRAHITGVVFQVVAGAGSAVGAGDPILILESMKMEIPATAPQGGVVRQILVAQGEAIAEGQTLLILECQ